MDNKDERSFTLLRNYYQMLDFIEELAKPPYEDSDKNSLYEWANARAKSIVKDIKQKEQQ